MVKARGEVRKLLIVIGKLQSLIGGAESNHNNDKDPCGFEKGQKKLREAFQLCIDATGNYDQIVERGK